MPEMPPVLFRNPFELPWQTVLFDVLMAGLFIAAVVHAFLQFRRGTRIYAFLLVAALIYGVVLELAGMATLNMYVQGDFPVMLNFPAIPLFAGTTAMPLYVTLFYPVIFTIGFKIVEGLSIAKPSGGADHRRAGNDRPCHRSVLAGQPFAEIGERAASG